MSYFGEIWKGRVRRFWWLRGVAGAVTLTALVPNIVDLSRYEFLRAFHALIVGWNVVAARLGYIIGKIPFVPELSGEVISTFFFSLSIVFPIAFAIVTTTLRKNISKFIYYLHLAIKLFFFFSDFLFIYCCILFYHERSQARNRSSISLSRSKIYRNRLTYEHNFLYYSFHIFILCPLPITRLPKRGYLYSDLCSFDRSDVFAPATVVYRPDQQLCLRNFE